MRQRVIKLALLVGVLGAFALAPALAQADNYDVYVQDTAWNPETLTLVPGDTVTWFVNKQADNTNVSGHDLWVCEGKDNPDTFETVDCWYDKSDPEATPPANYIGGRAYCGWYEPGVDPDKCDDGQSGSVTLTFDNPGDYVYYCSVHGPMRGAISVAAPAPNLKISIKPKSKKLKKGKNVTATVTVNNNGEGDASGVKVCASGPKKKVKVGKCVNVGTVPAGGSKKAKIKITVQKGKKAKGSAKVTFKTTGNAPVKTLSGKVTINIKK